MLLNIVFLTLVTTLMRDAFSLKLQVFGYTVHLVRPGSDWTLSAHRPHPTPPHAPLLILSQARRHTVTVSMSGSWLSQSVASGTAAFYSSSEEVACVVFVAH